MSIYLNWNDVKAMHGTIAAVSIENNFVKSLLCGGSDYEDIIFENEIIYKIPNRNYYAKSVKTIKETQSHKLNVRVFLKIGRNKWRDAGIFEINEIVQLDEFWEIRLKK
jgi:hypothetical protein